MDSTQVYDAIWNWGTALIMGVMMVKVISWVVIESYIDLKYRWGSRNFLNEKKKIEE